MLPHTGQREPRTALRFSHPGRYQHSIIMTESGGYMLFDNADTANWAGEADTSSVIRLTVDEENMTVTDFVRYSVLDYFSNYMGAIRELDAENSVYLWSVGGNYSIDSDTPPEWSMIEYTETDGGVSYHFSVFVLTRAQGGSTAPINVSKVIFEK